MNDNEMPTIETPSTIAVPDALHPDFGDIESMFNMRTWLEGCVTAKGAKVVGGGMGMGSADIEIVLEGHEYDINIRPRIKG